MALTSEEYDAKFEELKQLHGKVFRPKDPTIQVICRRAKFVEVQMFTDTVGKGQLRAAEALILNSAVYPERDDLKKVIEEEGGFLIPLALAVSGLGTEVEVRKS